jgi:1-deoxy-D-xylulose-5-phosphate reductoisomerase
MLEQYNAKMTAADSEHSAIFQALQVRARHARTPNLVGTLIPRPCRPSGERPAHFLSPHLRTFCPASSSPLLQGVPPGALRRVILTASGGAFRDFTNAELREKNAGTHSLCTASTRAYLQSIYQSVCAFACSSSLRPRPGWRPRRTWLR